jgi:hypothetical protein
MFGEIAFCGRGNWGCSTEPALGFDRPGCVSIQTELWNGLTGEGLLGKGGGVRAGNGAVEQRALPGDTLV